MNATIFYTWIITQSERRDEVGDLAKDIKRDGRAPKGNASHDEWLLHLIHSRASRESIQGFDQAWSEFKSN